MREKLKRAKKHCKSDKKKKKKVYTEILGLKTLLKAKLPLTFVPP